MTYDWNAIKERFLNGEGMSAISDSMGNRPTLGAISKRCKKENWKALLSAQFSESANVTLRKDRPETRQKVLELLERGATYTLAAHSVGIHPDTLANWRKGSEEFRNECEQAQTKFSMAQIERIDTAGKKDWRAARSLLQNHPHTKGDFGANVKTGTGMVVNFGIIRDASLLNKDGTRLEKDVTPKAELIEVQASAD